MTKPIKPLHAAIYLAATTGVAGLFLHTAGVWA